MEIKNNFKTEPKYIINCEMCGHRVKTYWPTVKTCSKECQNKRTAKLTGRNAMIESSECVASGTVGAISELLVCADLMKRGYAVFRALSPSCFCDAVAIKGEKIIRVEIRTGYKNTLTGNFQFPTKLSIDKNNQADCYGVYERNSGSIVYLDLNKNIMVL